MKTYDLVIMGSGPAGHAAAVEAGKRGLNVAVIEKSRASLGGVCLNEGCIPAKSLYASAAKINTIRNLADFFPKTEFEAGHLKVDIKKIVDKSKETTEILKKSLEFTLKKHKVDIIYGVARFVSSGSIKVEREQDEILTISGKYFLIATGSRPGQVKGLEYDGDLIISSKEAINLEEIPGNVLVVGAGAIGVEFADFFNFLGTKVVLLEAAERILPQMDKDISRGLSTILKKRGVDIITGEIVTGVKRKGLKGEVTTSLKGPANVLFDKIIVAVGRSANTQNMGLDKAGVKVDPKGFILTDGALKTSNPKIAAAGDVINSPMLAHTASLEGIYAAKNLLGETTADIDYSMVPYVVYSHVRASSVGDKEKGISSSGTQYKSYKVYFKANGRAVSCDEAEGFIKLVIGAKGYIEGASIVGVLADEIIHEITLAKTNGLTINDIAKTVHAHPTFSELLQDMAKEIVWEREKSEKSEKS